MGMEGTGRETSRREVGRSRRGSAVVRAGMAALLASVVTVSWSGLVATAGDAAEVAGPIRSIDLSNGGLARIVRTAEVTGDATILIDVPIDQVDDILKSLIVHDGTGSVTGMTLAGEAPIEEAFRMLPFSPGDMSDIGRLLSRLQGVEVTITVDGRSVTGRVLGIDEGEPGKGTRTLGVIDDDGTIRTIPLAKDAAVRIVDDGTRRRIEDAIDAIGTGRTDEARRISIGVSGTDRREVSISYVITASLWKTAYRLVLDDEPGKARIQAWAVLENSSGEDWNDVDVTLSSGSPVTLRQELHRRHWRNRSAVPVDGDASTEAAARQVAELRAEIAPAAPMAKEAYSGLAMPTAAAADAFMSAPTQAVETDEGTAAVTFHLPGKVDLGAGDSMSAPILDVRIPVSRVALFRPGHRDAFPDASLLIRNETAGMFPRGIVTVFDGTGGYLGDVSLPSVPPGKEEAAVFAVDRKIRIDVRTRPSGVRTALRIVDGMARLTTTARETTTYSIEGAADEERTVVIEHPSRGPEWTFVSRAYDRDVDNAHRLRTIIAPGASSTIEAVDERVSHEIHALADADPALLVHWSSIAPDEATARKLTIIAKARADLAKAERSVERIDAGIETLIEDQERTRENLRAVPESDPLSRELVSGIRSLDADIRTRRTDLERASVDLEDRRRKLESLIRSL